MLARSCWRGAAGSCTWCFCMGLTDSCSLFRRFHATRQPAIDTMLCCFRPDSASSAKHSSTLQCARTRTFVPSIADLHPGRIVCTSLLLMYNWLAACPLALPATTNRGAGSGAGIGTTMSGGVRQLPSLFRRRVRVTRRTIRRHDSKSLPTLGVSKLSSFCALHLAS